MSVQLMLEKHVETFRTEMLQELAWAANSTTATKDILIVVRDQLNYLQECIESIMVHTTNYHLYLWDNGSAVETEQYLLELQICYPDKVCLIRSENNQGFIEPNNRLAAMGQGEYLILLNSDTKVFTNWDRALVGCLQNNPEVALVGYQGCCLDGQGLGGLLGFGFEIDYVCGWGCCLSRKTYQKQGLFNPELQFAYCEDADLSLRLQTSGQKVYALHLLLVHHYENKTIKVVTQEGEVDVYATFAHNHRWLKEHWRDYLQHSRVQVRKDPICGVFQ